MRNNIPILQFSSHLPNYHDVGIYLDASLFHGGAETSAVWLHGILVLQPNEDEQGWLRALNITVISEANQLPQIANVIAGRSLLQEHFSDVVLEGDVKARVLPFSFDLRDVLGHGLYDDNFFIHISARHYCSKPIRIVRAATAVPSYLATTEESQCYEVDQLLKAYDAWSAKRFFDAVEFFTAALKSDELRGDLDRPNLYNAAYCASQAALETEAALAAQLFAKTTQWRQEDLQRSNNLLLQIQKSLTAQNEGHRQQELVEKRAQLLRDLGLHEAVP